MQLPFSELCSGLLSSSRAEWETTSKRRRHHEEPPRLDLPQTARVGVAGSRNRTHRRRAAGHHQSGGRIRLDIAAPAARQRRHTASKHLNPGPQWETVTGVFATPDGEGVSPTPPVEVEYLCMVRPARLRMHLVEVQATQPPAPGVRLGNGGPRSLETPVFTTTTRAPSSKFRYCQDESGVSQSIAFSRSSSSRCGAEFLSHAVLRRPTIHHQLLHMRITHSSLARDN